LIHRRQHDPNLMHGTWVHGQIRFLPETLSSLCTLTGLLRAGVVVLRGPGIRCSASSLFAPIVCSSSAAVTFASSASSLNPAGKFSRDWWRDRKLIEIPTTGLMICDLSLDWRRRREGTRPAFTVAVFLENK
jgi:hypothetical protein